MIKIQQKGYFQSIQQFHIFENKVLGYGSFGMVILATHIKTCKLYAIKIINLHKYSQRQQLKLLEKQNKIHSLLEHPHIVKLWDNILEDNRLYMIMEYIEKGTLFHYQNTCVKFTQVQAFKYFYQTLKAVKYLHSHHIIHRDLKPENLLLDANLNIKICDLGWATLYSQKKRNTFCGTFQYMAPEIIFSKQYDTKVDIWALGVLLYQMLHGYAPFRGQKIQQIKQRMKVGAYAINTSISEQCKDIIVNILKFQQEKRITIQDIQMHAWVMIMKKKLKTLYIQNQYYSTNNTNLIKLNINNLQNNYKTNGPNQKNSKNTYNFNHTNNRKITENMNSIPQSRSQTNVNRNSQVAISEQLNLGNSQKLTSYKQLCTVSTKNTINLVNLGKKLVQESLIGKIYEDSQDLGQKTPIKKINSNKNCSAHSHTNLHKNNNDNKSISRKKNQSRKRERVQNKFADQKNITKRQNITNFNIYGTQLKQKSQLFQQFTKRRAHIQTQKYHHLKTVSKRCKTMNFQYFSYKKSKDKDYEKIKQKQKSKQKLKQKSKEKLLIKKKKDKNKYRNLTPKILHRRSQQKINQQQFSIYIKKNRIKNKSRQCQNQKTKTKTKSKQKQIQRSNQKSKERLLKNIKSPTSKQGSNKNFNFFATQPIIKKK